MLGIDKIKNFIMNSDVPDIYTFATTPKFLKIFSYLDTIPYFYMHPLDENRLMDAVSYKLESGDTSVKISFMDIFFAFDERLFRDFMTTNSHISLSPMYLMLKHIRAEEVDSKEEMRELLTDLMSNKIGFFSHDPLVFAGRDLYAQASWFLQEMDFLL